MKKGRWFVISCLVVIAVIMTSCQTTTEQQTETSGVTTTSTSSATPVTTSPALTISTVPATTPVTTENNIVKNAFGKEQEKPQYGGMLTMSFINGPTFGFDPARYWYTSEDYLNCVYEKLAWGDWTAGPGGRNVYNFDSYYVPSNLRVGRLAESWEMSTDGLTYIVHLRKGIYFQNKAPVNGRELVATDVKYCFDRQWGSGSGFTKPPQMQRLGTPAAIGLQEITCPDKYTVVFKLSQPFMMGINGLLFYGYNKGIYPREIVDKYGDMEDWKNACGTGPYMLTDFVLDSSATYNKNPNYWGYDELFPNNRMPYIDRVRVLIIPDRSTTLSAFKVGKIDWVAESGALLNYLEAEELKKSHPEKVLYPVSRDSGRILYMNMDNPVLKNLKVRQALQAAISLDDLRAIDPGMRNDVIARPNTYVQGPLLNVPFEKLPQDIQDNYKYNPEKAKKLLSEAGYPNGFKAEILCGTTQDPIINGQRSAIQAMFAKIGVTVEFNIMEAAALTVATRDRKWQWFVYGDLGWAQPYTNFTQFSSTVGQYYNLYDSEFESQYQKMILTIDEKERAKLAVALEQYFLRNLFVLSYPTTAHRYQAQQPWFKGTWGVWELDLHDWFTITQRAWIDTNLKYKLTGIK